MPVFTESCLSIRRSGTCGIDGSKQRLRRLFAPYGKLKRAEIKRGRFGDSLMHGFVELDHLSLSAATQAMRELDAAKFMGRRLRVHWAFSNAHRSGDRDRERERDRY